MRKSKEAPDWLGCGRTITTESWDRFLKARREYWYDKDAKRIEQITERSNQAILRELKH